MEASNHTDEEADWEARCAGALAGAAILRDENRLLRLHLESARAVLKDVASAFAEFSAAQQALDAARFHMRLSSLKYCLDETQDFVRADRAVDSAIARLHGAILAAGEAHGLRD